MQFGTCDRLLLHQQPGANLYVAADAERVDALVTGCLARTGANGLPVIIFRTVIYGFDGLAAFGNSQEGKSPIAVQIGSVENHR